jgi:UDP-N-acetylmuramoyl-tripeptide--D-alanyl-D-alanine ligase
VIAVTGSNGKTTVTQMLASVLDACHPNGASLATRGNLNNDIGVPLTLLRLRAHHAMAVVELGMNHPGEIAALAAMAQPTVALVNNAQREHLEFMQTVQAVAQENGAVLSALDPRGVAVFPSDDEYTAVWQGLAGARRCVEFSLAANPDIKADALGCVSAQWVHGAWQVHGRGMGTELHYPLAIAGRHNVKNSLAAAACALAAGVPVDAVQRGLEAFIPVKGRSRAMALQVKGHELTLVDDTYNANPDSVRAAIDVLAELPGPRLLVLGDMGEVGQQGPEFHAEAGRYAQACGIEHLVALGELTQSTVGVFAGAQHFDSVDALNAAVRTALPELGSVLVKGSRFMRMERVVEFVIGETPCC